jgi:hypothetical protein
VSVLRNEKKKTEVICTRHGGWCSNVQSKKQARVDNNNDMNACLLGVRSTAFFYFHDWN